MKPLNPGNSAYATDDVWSNENPKSTTKPSVSMTPKTTPGEPLPKGAHPIRPFHDVLRKHGYKPDRSSHGSEEVNPTPLHPDQQEFFGQHRPMTPEHSAEHDKLYNAIKENHKTNDFYKPSDHPQNVAFRERHDDLVAKKREIEKLYREEPQYRTTPGRQNIYTAPGKPDVEIYHEKLPSGKRRISHETVEPGYQSIGYAGKGPKSLDRNIKQVSKYVSGEEESDPFGGEIGQKIVKALTAKDKPKKKETIN